MNRLARPLTRPVGLAVVVALAAFLAASCSYTNPPVMTMAVNGKEQPFFTMSWDDVQKQLDTAAASSGASTSTTAPTYHSAADIATLLTNTARQEAVKQIVAERNIKTTDADTAAAQAQSQSSSSSSSQPQEIEVQIAALQRSLAEEAFASGKIDQNAQAQALFTANQASYSTPAQLCLHIIEVDPTVASGSGAPTPEELQAAVQQANAVRARIGAETFEAVADSVNSQQVQQSAPGGKVGCIAKPTSFPDDAWAQIEALPVGSVSQPITVADQVVYIFQLDDNKKATTPTFDQVKDKVTADLAYKVGQQLLNDYLVKRAADLVVVVDSRYGRWDPAQFAILPPEGAAQPTVPTTTTTTAPSVLAPSTTVAPTSGSTPPATGSTGSVPAAAP